MTGRRRFPRVAASVAAVVLAVGCAASPPDVGARRCAWPGQVDPARDALLLNAPPHWPYLPSVAEPAEALLLDVASGRIVARCPSLRLELIDSTAFDGKYATTASIFDPPHIFTDTPFSKTTLPPLSRDRRMALDQPDGVVDLVSGTTFADPDPGWRAVGFAGDAVLRERLFAPGEQRLEGAGFAPGSFCVAARPDTPQSDCAPIAGATENGLPSITDSGAVEWAPDSREVPLALRRADGATYTGIAQVSPTRIADLHIVSPPDPSGAGHLEERRYFGAFDNYAPLSRTETVLAEVMTSYGDLEPAPSDPGQRERISWFVDPAVTATGVTAQLHAATTTWPQARAAGHALSDAAPYCASVIDHGTAALLVFQSPPLRAGQSISFSFVRVPEAGPPTIVARLGATVPGGPATGSDLDQQPWIVSWP